jgi:hypothetical protein
LDSGQHKVPKEYAVSKSKKRKRRTVKAASLIADLNQLSTKERVRFFSELQSAHDRPWTYEELEVYDAGEIAVIEAPETADQVRAILDILPDKEREEFQTKFMEENWPIAMKLIEKFLEQRHAQLIEKYKRERDPKPRNTERDEKVFCLRTENPKQWTWGRLAREFSSTPGAMKAAYRRRQKGLTQAANGTN